MGVKETLHLLAAIHFWFGCYYDWYYVVIPPHVHKMGESFGFSGKLKFLTYWNALLQGVFYTVCFLDDLLDTNKNIERNHSWTRKLRDLLLTSLAFPLSMFVGLSFWGIYMVDRQLIFPREIDAYFPSWLNHLMHTNIILFIVLELGTSFRRYPSRKQGLSILAVVMLAYLIWVHVIHHYTEVWVYPILEVLNLPLRLLFFSISIGLLLLLYILGEKLNNVIWNKQLKILKRP